MGRTHKDPPLMFRVLYLARPRTGTRSFMVDAGEMKSHRPRIWCLSARFSRLFPPALSGSGVRLKERVGRGESLCFPKGLEELGDVLDQRLEGLAIDVLSLAGLVAFEHLLNTFVRVRVCHEPCAHGTLQGGLVSQ